MRVAQNQSMTTNENVASCELAKLEMVAELNRVFRPLRILGYSQ